MKRVWVADELIAFAVRAAILLVLFGACTTLWSQPSKPTPTRLAPALHCVTLDGHAYCGVPAR